MESGCGVCDGGRPWLRQRSALDRRRPSERVALSPVVLRAAIAITQRVSHRVKMAPAQV